VLHYLEHEQQTGASDYENNAMIITLNLTPAGWTATFKGAGSMPQGVALPLPWTAQARRDHVPSDLQRRFPTARIR
jgi:hypothetical protein